MVGVLGGILLGPRGAMGGGGYLGGVIGFALLVGRVDDDGRFTGVAVWGDW